MQKKSKIKKILIFLVKVYALQTPMMVSFVAGLLLSQGDFEFNLENMRTMVFWQTIWINSSINVTAKMVAGMVVTYILSTVFALWALLPKTFMKVVRTRIDLKNMRIIEANERVEAQKKMDELQSAFVAFIRHMKSIHIAQGTWKKRYSNVINDAIWVRKELYAHFTAEYGPDLKQVFKTDDYTKLYKKYFKEDTYEIYNKVH